MAVIVGVKAFASYPLTTAISLPVSDNIDGDLIVIAYQVRSTSATVTCSGFTHAYSATASSWKSGFLYKVNSGGTTASAVTVSSTVNAYFGATSYVIRGAAASPIGNTGNSNSGSSKRLSSATFTTAANHSLILHGFASDQNAMFQPEVGAFNLLSRVRTESGSVGSGCEYLATAGSIPAFYWNSATAAQCVDAAIEIKSDGTNIPISVVPNRTVLAYHGGYDPTAPTTSAPNSVSGLTAIKSVTLASSAASIVNSAPSTWLFSGMATDTTSAATQFEGVFESHTIDLTNKVLSFPWAISRSPIDGRIGTYGMICVLADSSNNWVAYTLRDFSTDWTPSWSYAKFIKYGSTPELESSLSLGGTEIDVSDIVKIGFFWHRLTSGGAGQTYLYIGQLSVENSAAVVTGGGPDAPLKADGIARHLLCNEQWPGLVQLQGRGQYKSKTSLQLGDGTIPTYFKSTGQSFEYSAIDADWALADGDIGITLKASASCTFDLSASIFSGASLQNFTIDAASSASAGYVFTGASFIGLDWASNAAVDFSGASYTLCNLTELGGGDVSNASITSPAGTTAATVSTSGGTLDGVSINTTKADGSAANYHITYGTAVTSATLTDVSFVGSPAVDKVHVLKTTGTVTINVNGTTSLLAADVTSDGATVDIVSSPVYQTVTISNATAGSRIQIYDTTHSTELYNGTPTFPYTWTDPSPATSSRAIRLRVAYVSGATAKEFIEANIGTCGTSSGDAAVSYLVGQVNDTTYNSNGINGPSIYAGSGITFTDATPDRVNCNIGGGSVTWPTIYACFVYWNFTATGIANDFTYVDAPDTANYLLSGMKVRNTSATGLMVIGGYGRDASTGLSKDIIDTAGSTGNIFLAPDHVVAYQTTGTYAITGDISTVLAAIPAAATNAAAVRTELTTELARIDVATSTRLATAGYTAPDNAGVAAIKAQTDELSIVDGYVAADAKKMNGATITGNGTSGNKWRGA